MSKLVNIAFNLPVDSLFTYIIPENIAEEVSTGSRVLAPFGKRNITGIAMEFPESTSKMKASYLPHCCVRGRTHSAGEN